MKKHPPRAAPKSRVARAVMLVGLAMVLLARVGAIAQRVTVPRPSSMRTTLWDFPSTPMGRMQAVVLTPRAMPAGARLPLLVAMHGWGETLRGVERGVWGWPRDYELGASERELRMTRLRSEAFLGHVEGARLTALRADLTARPYQGVVVVAPFTPDVLDGDAGALQHDFDQWLVETLVPRARRELMVLTTREATGIDGVSLGGLHALEVGFAHPEVFGVVGTLQPAVRGRIPRVMGRYTSSAQRPAQRIRLVTSHGDVFRTDVMALHDAMTTRGIAHDLRVLAGPHDYVFNRGPGGVEMLLFHDRALRGMSAL